MHNPGKKFKKSCLVRYLYFVLLLLCSLLSIGQKEADLNDIIGSFNKPYTIKQFDAAFLSGPKSETLLRSEAINDYIDIDLLSSSKWKEEKDFYLFLIDSIYLPEKAYEKVLRLAIELERIEHAEENVDTAYLVDILNIQAEYLKLRGERLLSQDKREEALKCLNEQGQKDFYRLAYTYYFYHFLFSDNNPSKAIEVLKDAELNLLKMESQDPHFERKIYSEIQKYYNSRGYYDEARKYFDKIWKPYYKNGRYLFSDLKEEADFLYESMYFARLSGNYDNTFRILDHTDQFYKKHKDHTDFPTISIAGVYSVQGDNIVNSDPRKALMFYQKALEINPAKDSYHLQYLFNISKAYLYNDQAEKALMTIEKVIPLALELEDTRLPFFYAMKANIYMSMDNFKMALNFLEVMINEMNQGNNSIDLNTEYAIEFTPSDRINEMYMVTTMADRFKEYFSTDEKTKLVSKKLYHAALKILKHNLINQVANAHLKSVFDQIVLGIIGEEDGERYQIPIEEIILCSEHLESGYLWEKFKSNNADLVAIDEDLLKREEALRSDIIQLKKDDESDSGALFEKEVLLKNLETEKANRYPGYTQFSTFDFNLDAFRNEMDEDLTVLKYLLIQNQYFLFKIKEKGIEMVELGSKDSINNIAKSLYEKLKTPFSDLDSIHQLAEQLATIIIPEHVPNGQKILVVPDGLLTYIPFGVLRTKDNYLLQNHEIQNAVSLSLSGTNSTTTTFNKAALFAPSYSKLAPEEDYISLRGEAYDLEGAKMEINEISKIISSDIYTEDLATKENFKSNAPNYGILHLSMHSFLNEENPELSSLVFSDNIEDFELYLSELYGMNLNAELAVLSACNTAIGPEQSGEEIVSMNRAFNYAGVPAIISSLWSAPDLATQEIMATCYQKLKEGNSISASLRQAKLFFLEDKAFTKEAHPFYWAGFVHHGSNKSFSFRTFQLWWLLLPGALCLAGLIIGVRFRILRKS